MQFVVPEFRNGQFEKDFTETSFIDNATQAATFTYSTTDKDLPLQRVDVITVPHGANHQMKSVYLERQPQSPATAASWKRCIGGPANSSR